MGYFARVFAILFFLALAVGLFKDIPKLFTFRDAHPGRPDVNWDPKRISHQAAPDMHQYVLLDDTAWFDNDGIPLFYSAWRVKPGPLSPEPAFRSALLKYGARVTCWPSTNDGIWIKQADLVDMNFLAVSRFENTPRQFNTTAEDQFCKKLRMIGAEFWIIPPPFEERAHLGLEQFACDTLGECFTPGVVFPYYIAWPQHNKAACYVSVTEAEKRTNSLLNGWHRTMNMDEKCCVIMSLGGKWCHFKSEFPDLQDLDWGDWDRREDICGSSGYWDLEPEELDFAAG